MHSLSIIYVMNLSPNAWKSLLYFFLFKCLPFQPMEELVNFFIQTAGCKSSEFINRMTRARLHQTVRKNCSTFRNSPIWSALRYTSFYFTIKIYFSFCTVPHFIVLNNIVLYFTMGYLLIVLSGMSCF